jgi:glyoxylase-like metal-dependent hydrolase (beta-lactamase superfamily II)
MTEPNFNSIIHKFTGATVPVNAYLVETENGVVAVDSTLTVSDSTALRRKLETLNKPLLAVIVTHAHPDHYAGLKQLVQSDEVPILATEGVNAVIRRDDALKNQIISPMFGAEWPQQRRFPNQTVQDGDQITFDGLTLIVKDIGPAESPHDSIWLLNEAKVAFIGDLVYNHMHAYLADGYYPEWLEKIAQLREALDDETRLYMGHGEPGSTELFDWQTAYIQTFVEAVKAVKGSDSQTMTQQVTEKMQAFLPSEDLLFLAAQHRTGGSPNQA